MCQTTRLGCPMLKIKYSPRTQVRTLGSTGRERTASQRFGDEVSRMLVVLVAEKNPSEILKLVC